jgi:tripartite-type tricarboxylate transporter receptor subunit TctC
MDTMSPTLHYPRKSLVGETIMTLRIQPAIVAALVMLGAAATPLLAQDYPSRAVTIVVPQPPGGGTDIISRVMADQLSRQFKQTFVIENRAGAGTVVGSAVAAKAPPDGYTLLAGLNANMAVNPSLFKTLAYDPVRDFTPVGMMAEYPFVIVVSKDFPAHSVKELIALAKAKPGEINFASAGNGSGQHLSMELFKLMTGTNLTHVPYRGAAPAYADVISGRTPVFCDNLSSALGQITGGNVRALAVTSKQRAPLLPDVPTVAETVPDFENTVWFGLWAPKKTPQPIIAALHAQMETAVTDATFKERVTKDGGKPMTTPLADIEPMVKAEITKWADVVKRANIALQ